MRRTLTLLHKMTIIKYKGKRLSAPAFCYCFPLIRSALISVLTRPDDSIITLGLQLISEHAKMRFLIDDNEIHSVKRDVPDTNHPDLLPRKYMFELLIELISKYKF